MLTALTLGRRPVVVPRLRRFGEAVDDHQLIPLPDEDPAALRASLRSHGDRVIWAGRDLPADLAVHWTGPAPGRYAPTAPCSASPCG